MFCLAISACVAKLQELQDSVRHAIVQSLEGAKEVVRNIENQLGELRRLIERACVQLCDDSGNQQLKQMPDNLPLRDRLAFVQRVFDSVDKVRS